MNEGRIPAKGYGPRFSAAAPLLPHAGNPKSRCTGPADRSYRMLRALSAAW